MSIFDLLLSMNNRAVKAVQIIACEADCLHFSITAWGITPGFIGFHKSYKINLKLESVDQSKSISIFL